MWHSRSEQALKYLSWRARMDIFLSWSGDRSKHIAEILKKRLPYFIQAVKPYMSSSDIDKGTRWSTDIASKLAQCAMGIICLTPENIEAPWILFEAGALSKTLDTAHVCPLLFEIEPSDLKGPLVQFQLTKLLKDDFRKLINTINKCLDAPISEIQVNESFEAWWPKVEDELKELLLIKKYPSPKRKDREILEEILELVRQQTRNSSSIDVPTLSKFALGMLSKPPIGKKGKANHAKTRVYELAQKMGVDKEELIERLKAIGVPVTNHMSVIDEDDMKDIIFE
jgi:hypothetical protein